MIDREAALAYRFAPVRFEVERGRLRAFARAIGETDPIYSDLDAAGAAGHRDLPVPPTFFFGMTLEAERPFDYLEHLGVELGSVLHGEQSFDYRAMAYAGDELVLQDRITDVYERRGGAMELFVRETEILRGEELVVTARAVLVVRHPTAGAA